MRVNKMLGQLKLMYDAMKLNAKGDFNPLIIAPIILVLCIIAFVVLILFLLVLMFTGVFKLW